MTYVKMVSDGTWFDEGTEVYSAKDETKSPTRMTKEEFEESWKPYGFALVLGTRSGSWDQETCTLDEFEISEVEYGEME